MANTSSAKKAIRVSERKSVVNKKLKVAYKSARKDFVKAVKENDTKKAKELLTAVYKKIDKAVKGNVIHANTGARYKSAMAKMLK